MKLLVVGHSLIHDRQAAFFLEVARQGADVLVLHPEAWGNLKRLAPLEWIDAARVGSGSFQMRSLLALGEPDMYHYSLVGLDDLIKESRPDVVYVQQEIACDLTKKALALAKGVGAKTAVFVWENIRALSPEEMLVLKGFDLVVCGNDGALEIHAGARNLVALPQVGVDTDHFAAREGVGRGVDVGFVGRPVAEKGIDYLVGAWPTAKITPWTDWRSLPWLYSQAKVIVTYSLDTPFWREQAPNYVSAEAMATGCAVVTSDGGAIPWWLNGGYARPCPGATIVEQHQPEKLRAAIAEAVQSWEERGKAGRLWVEENLSSRVVARRLLEAFDAAG